MKASIYFTFLLLTGISLNSFGQEPKKQKPDVLSEAQRQKQQHNFYRKTLQVDSVKADQVSQVQAAYKASLKLVIADTSLNEVGKRAKISALMEIKNQKLRTLLSPAQQEKIIPSTERISSKSAKQP